MDDDITDHKGFSVMFMIAELSGAMVVVFITIWLGHYQGGFAWDSNPLLQFNWHPVLMSLGMIFFYGNAIMLYRAFRNQRKKILKLVHAGIHCFVFLFTVIALQAVFNFHNQQNIPNMYSLHSWLGIVTVSLYTFQLVVGFTAFIFPGIQSTLRRLLMPYHTFWGLVLFIFAVATGLMGILEKAQFGNSTGAYSHLKDPYYMVNFAGLLLVLFGLLVVYLVATPRFRRLPLPEDEMLLADSTLE